MGLFNTISEYNAKSGIGNTIKTGLQSLTNGELVSKFNTKLESKLSTIQAKSDTRPVNVNNTPMNPTSVVDLTGQPCDVSFDTISIPATGDGFYAYMIRCKQPLKQDKDTGQDPGYMPGVAVRRPILGVNSKEFSPASIFLTDAGNTSNLPSPTQNQYDSLRGETATTRVNFNFLMQSISQSYVENTQLVETFGKTYIFFFGRKPTAVTINGLLLNTRDFNWRNDWLHNYMELLRGTKASLHGKEVVLSYDDLIFTGYVLSMGMQETSDNRDLASFNMEMLITKISILPSYSITGRTPHGYESKPGGDRYTQEYFEYIGPAGLTNKEGKKDDKSTIYLFTSFNDVLSHYIGFNLRSVSRIKALANVIKRGSASEIAKVGLLTWSSAAQKRGAGIFELDRILRPVSR